MNVVAEMVTLLPMKGISIPYFVERFVDPSLRFAAGWNYWYAYAMLVAAETSAAAIVIDYCKLYLFVSLVESGAELCLEGDVFKSSDTLLDSHLDI